jgi:hypothetical protein
MLPLWRLVLVLTVGSPLVAPSGFIPGSGEGDCDGGRCGEEGVCVLDGVSRKPPEGFSANSRGLFVILIFLLSLSVNCTPPLND